MPVNEIKCKIFKLGNEAGKKIHYFKIKILARGGTLGGSTSKVLHLMGGVNL